MRIVLDTDVLVAGIRSRFGASRALLVKLRRSELTGLVSVPLILEYEAVLKRPEHLAASGASLADVDVILDTLAALLEPVEVHFAWRPLLKDPSDDMVLETAMNGRAGAIVTFNLRDFDPITRRFGIQCVRPGEMVRNTG